MNGKAVLLLIGLGGLALASGDGAAPGPGGGGNGPDPEPDPPGPGGGGGGVSVDPQIVPSGPPEPPAFYLSGKKMTDWFGAQPEALADKVPVLQSTALTLAGLATLYMRTLSVTPLKASEQMTRATMSSKLDGAYEVLFATSGTGPSAAESVVHATHDVVDAVNFAGRNMDVRSRLAALVDAIGLQDDEFGFLVARAWSAPPAPLMLAVSQTALDAPWTAAQKALVERAIAEGPGSWAL